MKNYRFVILLFLLAVCPLSYGQMPPVNPNATPEAKALLALLHRISGEYIISGQHNYSHRLNLCTDTTKVITGKTPLIWGCDVADFRPESHQRIIDEAIRHYKDGFIITLMWHASVPDPKRDEIFKDRKKLKQLKKGEIPNSWYNMSEKEWMEILTPGTAMHEQWIKDVDKAAEPLKALQKEGIPVLWRPYHEMNGMWFWWGNRRGENGFAKLWKMIYDRYTNYHKLNNLIWVWNSNAPRDWKDDEAYDYALFYPGHEYVDVLAADVYKNDFKQSHHDDLAKLASGKVIALGEVGEAPTPEILTAQPQWAWFMIWAGFNWKNNSPEDLKRLHNDNRVITLENSSIIMK